MTFSAAATIFGVSSPYFFNSSVGVPLSPKVSLVPTYSMGIGKLRATVCATAIIKSVQKTGCAVTAEEHNIIGGLGDAVAQTVARNFPIPIEYVGTNDTFGESGTPTELLKKYGLDTPNIVAAAEKVLARKNK